MTPSADAEGEATAEKLLAIVGVDGFYLTESREFDTFGYGIFVPPDAADFSPPVVHTTGVGCLADLGIGPGRITLFGGPPKLGKTTLVNQIVLDALRANPELFAVIANAESSPGLLVKRMLARLSGVPIKVMESPEHTPEVQARLEQAVGTINALTDRGPRRPWNPRLFLRL